jgi:hypothetical protein
LPIRWDFGFDFIDPTFQVVQISSSLAGAWLSLCTGVIGIVIEAVQNHRVLRLRFGLTNSRQTQRGTGVSLKNLRL